MSNDIWFQDLYPWDERFTTRTFSDIFPAFEDFQSDYADSQIPLDQFGASTDDIVKTLYYLLYARYANSHIASSDENRFKYRMWSIIFSSGPTWKMRVALQDKIRALTDEQLIEGGKAIYNHANNPSTEPSTATLEELTAIDDQNTTNYKKNSLEAIMGQWEALRLDVTSDFIDKFRNLFIVVTAPGPIMAFPEI